MRLVLILVTLLLSVCDAARRRRTTTTTASTTVANFEGRQLGFLGQPEELENLWDRLEIQKLDNRAGPWRKNQVSNVTEFEGPNLSAGRQYPGFPSNPGDSNELPSPIDVTVEPQPSPAPGCLGLRGQFPSPKGCANYLNCWDEVVIEETCPDGLLFNDLTYVCDFDYNVNCGNRPLPTPKPPLDPGSKVCPDLNGRYRSATNCSEFFVCVVGRPVKFSCPRGLVYNDVLNVCDYPYNVDCKGSATPKPTPPPTYPPTYPPQQPTYPPQQPTYPPQQPTYPPQQPTYPPQQPTYPPQQPTYPPQQPTYPPQQPTYPPQQPTRPPQQSTRPSQKPTRPPQQPTRPPQQPTRPPQQPTRPPQQPTRPPQLPGYPPQQPAYPGPPQSGYPSYPAQPTQTPAYPVQQSGYPSNPWLNKYETDPWHQRPVASQLEIDKHLADEEIVDSQSSPEVADEDAAESPEISNPWNILQAVPAGLSKVPCDNGEIHRLNDACTSVVVCRNGRPQLVQCSSGFTYDKPSDSCRPFSVAKC